MVNLTTKRTLTETSDIRRNKLPVIGFALMLAGPVILVLAALFQDWQGDFSEFIAYAIMAIAIILPGSGFVISIISLRLWKKMGAWDRALSIVTAIMCNPFFLLYYCFICLVAGLSLAGLSWM